MKTIELEWKYTNPLSKDGYFGSQETELGQFRIHCYRVGPEMKRSLSLFRGDQKYKSLGSYDFERQAQAEAQKIFNDMVRSLLAPEPEETDQGPQPAIAKDGQWVTKPVADEILDQKQSAERTVDSEVSAPPKVDPVIQVPQAFFPRAQDITDIIQTSAELLASKKKILLAVNVSTPEEADEILNWLYLEGDDCPMKAKLVSIIWDSIPISRKVMEAVESLHDAIRNP